MKKQLLYYKVLKLQNTEIPKANGKIKVMMGAKNQPTFLINFN